jgi:hypothetical protein
MIFKFVPECLLCPFALMRNNLCKLSSELFRSLAGVVQQYTALKMNYSHGKLVSFLMFPNEYSNLRIQKLISGDKGTDFWCL